MGEQSHRDEMNAAIKAQRERQAARLPAAEPAPEQPAAPETAEPSPPPRTGLIARLLGR